MSEAADSQRSDSSNRRQATIERIFETMQQKIINALEVMLPEGFDFTDLEDLFSRQIKNQMDYGLLILNLLEYFIRVTSDNLVKQTDYTMLESQTQKLETEIRNHIKIEQSVKIYLQIKLRSLEKYKNEALQRRSQVKQLSARLREQQNYYQQVIHNLKNNYPPNKPSISAARIQDSGRTTLQVAPNNPHMPIKKSFIHSVDEQDNDDQLDDIIAQDLRQFQFLNQRVQTLNF